MIYQPINLIRWKGLWRGCQTFVDSVDQELLQQPPGQEGSHLGSWWKWRIGNGQGWTGTEYLDIFFFILLHLFASFHIFPPKISEDQLVFLWRIFWSYLFHVSITGAVRALSLRPAPSGRQGCSGRTPSLQDAARLASSQLINPASQDVPTWRFPKSWGYPPVIIHCCLGFPIETKPSIFGYPHSRKPPHVPTTF